MPTPCWQSASSLVGYGGRFRIGRFGANANKPIAAISLGMTRADALLSLKVEDCAERVLPALLGQLG